MRRLLGYVSRLFSGLQFRLLVLIVLVCAPLVALIMHTALEDRRRAMTSWRQRSQKVLQLSKREEDELVGGTRQLLLAVSESTQVRSLNAHQAKKWIDELSSSYERYSNLGLISTNGQIIATANPLAETENPADRYFFRRVVQTKSFAIGSFPTGGNAPKTTISFGYPVLDSTGEIQAVVYAELDLDWYSQFGSELPTQLPRGAFWVEINRNGTIMNRYPRPDEWIGQTLPERQLLSTFFSQPSGVVEATGYDSVENFYAFGSRPSKMAAGTVAGILGIPRQALFAEADRILKRNLGWLGLAATVAMVFGWAASRLLILRPLKALVRASARLGSGDLTARTGLPHGWDEVGQLTRAFDEMAEDLQNREKQRQQASQKLQVIYHRLVEVQETERRQIARELHDEIGQSLTAAEMNLQAALRTPGAAALERRLEDSIKAVERVLEQVQDLSLNLRPSMLDDLGLEPALRWYTQRQAELTGMRAEFRMTQIESRLDPVIETECFRVAQEALTNVVRHAQATAVEVELTRRNGHLHLSVRDDGVGFDAEEFRHRAVHGASLGLLSMEERATLTGGGLEFISAPGKGTEVHAWFPLRWHENGNAVYEEVLDHD